LKMADSKLLSRNVVCEVTISKKKVVKG
jgi:hypothetical protein